MKNVMGEEFFLYAEFQPAEYIQWISVVKEKKEEKLNHRAEKFTGNIIHTLGKQNEEPGG